MHQRIRVDQKWHSLLHLLQEMRFLTGRLREKDEENKTESDWKFAAMVIDRSYILFWLPKTNDQWRIIPEKYKHKKKWQGTSPIWCGGLEGVGGPNALKHLRARPRIN